jgi:hypothetical protein
VEGPPWNGLKCAPGKGRWRKQKNPLDKVLQKARFRVQKGFKKDSKGEFRNFKVSGGKG